LPEQGGVTTQGQPSLFWYISEQVDAAINLRMVAQDARQSLCDITVRHSDCRGIQRLDLAKFGISLSSDQDYAWMVSIVLDPMDRSKDVAVGGPVRRLPLSEKLKIELSDTEMAKRPAVLAAHGIWCDAFATLSDMIKAQPANAGLRQYRGNLLRQVGLNEAAASEPTGE
jgi:hypothetical protein